MTPEQHFATLVKKYKAQLSDLHDADDIETAHADADDILCAILTDLGYEEIVDAYNLVPKWYA